MPFPVTVGVVLGATASEESMETVTSALAAGATESVVTKLVASVAKYSAVRVVGLIAT